MRTLAFNGRMGASGDMLLGALLAVGADRDVLSPVESVLPVRYSTETVDRAGIAAVHVRVMYEDKDGDSEAGVGGHDHDGGHDHGNGEHTHADLAHGHAPAEGHGPERSFTEVVDIVESLALPDGVGKDAIGAFRILGEAEAAVHGTDIDEAHFHEVGADDAIADVVGTALLLDDLGVDRVVTTLLCAGSGEVEMAHGTYPVPPPAVVEIAKHADWSLRGGPVAGELLTPTGAALLAHFADGVETLPPMTVETSGYGAGSREYADRPNVLRASLGEAADPSSAVGVAQESGLRRDAITVLETTVDDVAPEILGGLHESLAAVGARDVAIIPATMKKSRPGHIVQVITKPADSAAVARRLAEETGTLGVREGSAAHRWIAERQITPVTVEVDDQSYEVGVKVAKDVAGERYDASAEYDDAQTVARETGVPVREVMRLAEIAYEDEA